MLHVGHRRLHFSKNKVDLMHLSGLSPTGLAAGPVIGFSQSPRTVLKFKYDLGDREGGSRSSPWDMSCLRKLFLDERKSLF